MTQREVRRAGGLRPAEARCESPDTGPLPRSHEWDGRWATWTVPSPPELPRCRSCSSRLDEGLTGVGLGGHTDGFEVSVAEGPVGPRGHAAGRRRPRRALPGGGRADGGPGGEPGRRGGGRHGLRPPARGGAADVANPRCLGMVGGTLPAAPGRLAGVHRLRQHRPGHVRTHPGRGRPVGRTRRMRRGVDAPLGRGPGHRLHPGPPRRRPPGSADDGNRGPGPRPVGTDRGARTTRETVWADTPAAAATSARVTERVADRLRGRRGGGWVTPETISGVTGLPAPPATASGRRCRRSTARTRRWP